MGDMFWLGLIVGRQNKFIKIDKFQVLPGLVAPKQDTQQKLTMFTLTGKGSPCVVPLSQAKNVIYAVVAEERLYS